MCIICPHCEKERDCISVFAKEVYVMKGMPIEVNVNYLFCETCNKSFDDPLSENDPIAEVYRKYNLLYDK